MNNVKPPDLSSQEEQVLIDAAKKGDQDAFAALVRRYERRVFALTARLCGNPQDAQEAAQEAFFSAWQGLSFFRGESSFATWLYRLTANACTDLLRREQRHRSAAGPSLNDAEQNVDLPAPEAGPAELAERAEVREAIERGLRALPEDYRSVLILREIHQLSYDEIAAALELDLGTVKSRISRGRKQLREWLTENGNFFAAHPSKETEKEGCK